MAHTSLTLRRVYDRTSGYCHICHKKLSFFNHGVPGKKGAWEVDHSRPRASGGSDRLNNMYPACVCCNRTKGISSTRSMRRHSGTRRAPLPRERRNTVRVEAGMASSVLGAVVGFPLGGPPVAIVGAALAGRAGYRANPDR